MQISVLICNHSSESQKYIQLFRCYLSFTLFSGTSSRPEFILLFFLSTRSSCKNINFVMDFHCQRTRECLEVGVSIPRTQLLHFTSLQSHTPIHILRSRFSPQKFFNHIFHFASHSAHTRACFLCLRPSHQSESLLPNA